MTNKPLTNMFEWQLYQYVKLAPESIGLIDMLDKSSWFLTDVHLRSGL